MVQRQNTGLRYQKRCHGWLNVFDELIDPPDDPEDEDEALNDYMDEYEDKDL